MRDFPQYWICYCQDMLIDLVLRIGPSADFWFERTCILFEREVKTVLGILFSYSDWIILLPNDLQLNRSDNPSFFFLPNKNVALIYFLCSLFWCTGLFLWCIWFTLIFFFTNRFVISVLAWSWRVVLVMMLQLVNVPQDYHFLGCNLV